MTDNHGVHHLAIIMDGNRRYAREYGLPTFEGHRRGYERLKLVGDWSLARGIKIVTVFAFSTENWNRTQEEVGYLMDLLEHALDKDLAYFQERGIRLRILGGRDRLRSSILRVIDRAEAETIEYSCATFCICLNYGGRREIVDAVKKILSKNIRPEQITEETIQQHLYWPDMPDPDLIIRTSGEERLSGFLLWQSSYSELYWCNHNWPEFDEMDLDAALESFVNRQRRFGK